MKMFFLGKPFYFTVIVLLNGPVHAERIHVSLVDNIQSGLVDNIQSGLVDNIQSGLVDNIQSGLVDNIQSLYININTITVKFS